MSWWRYDGNVGMGKFERGLIQPEFNIDGYLRGCRFSVFQTGRILPLLYRVRSSLPEKERPIQRRCADNFSGLIDSCGNRDRTLNVRLFRGRRVDRPNRRNQFRLAYYLDSRSRSGRRGGWRRRRGIGYPPSRGQQTSGGRSSRCFRGSNFGQRRSWFARIREILLRCAGRSYF